MAEALPLPCRIVPPGCTPSPRRLVVPPLASSSLLVSTYPPRIIVPPSPRHGRLRCRAPSHCRGSLASSSPLTSWPPRVVVDPSRRLGCPRVAWAVLALFGLPSYRRGPVVSFGLPSCRCGPLASFGPPHVVLRSVPQSHSWVPSPPCHSTSWCWVPFTSASFDTLALGSLRLSVVRHVGFGFRSPPHLSTLQLGFPRLRVFRHFGLGSLASASFDTLALGPFATAIGG